MLALVYGRSSLFFLALDVAISAARKEIPGSFFGTRPIGEAQKV